MTRRALGLVATIAFGFAVLAPAATLAASRGSACAGLVGIRCGDGLWCEIRAGLCNAADAPGTCVRVPEACATILAPVCGCDGKSYSNDCVRQIARVAKRHDGRCK